MATLWRSPSSPRALDAPALANPARIREWLAALSWNDQYGLIDRADSQMLLGDMVQVVAVSGGWAQVLVPDEATHQDARGYPGWVPVIQLNALAPPAADEYATVVLPTAWLFLEGVRSIEVSFGTRLPVVDKSASEARLGLPGGDRLDIPLSAVVLASSQSVALPRTAADLVATAREFLGLRYLWAGISGFGFDCSGLVYTVYKAHGVVLPRDANDQAGVGQPVSRSSLQPGDLVFLAAGGVVHHVALYVGSGMLLDSPDIAEGVQVVSISAQPYASEFWAARRVI